MRVDDAFQPRPYLAERWEISEDGLSYTFHLNRNARFPPITSQDVAFSLALVKQHHPFGIAMFDAVDRVDTPDAHTAVIRLARPHPALMQSLVPLLMPLPARLWRRPGSKTTMKRAPVGSGPFRVRRVGCGAGT